MADSARCGFCKVQVPVGTAGFDTGKPGSQPEFEC